MLRATNQPLPPSGSATSPGSSRETASQAILRHAAYLGFLPLPRNASTGSSLQDQWHSSSLNTCYVIVSLVPQSSLTSGSLLVYLPNVNLGQQFKTRKAHFVPRQLSAQGLSRSSREMGKKQTTRRKGKPWLVL